MSEEPQKQTLTLNNPEKADSPKENINIQKEDEKNIETSNPITIEVKNNGNEIQNSDNRINQKSTEEKIPIELLLNEKDIYQLPSEKIEKLNLLPCQICQSKVFSVYIPESFSSNNSKSENPEQQLNNNAELQTIKTKQQLTYFLPVLICEQNHQFCLLCQQNIHLDSFCKDENLNNDTINSMFTIIKEVIPEEKKNVLDSIYNYILSNPSRPKENQNSSCSGSCFCYTFLLIFLLFLWTIASIFLFSFGLILLFAAYGLRIVCCLYHCCQYICCTTTVKDEDKGDYILRTTTIHHDKEREIERDAENTDDCIAELGPMALAYSILLIPEVYKKIIGLYDGWKKNF